MFIHNQLIISGHFCGPTESGNGGYSAGLIATNVPFNAEVTLRKPPPLDHPMRLEVDGASARMLDGETLIAEARSIAAFEMEVPPVVAFDQAEKAVDSFMGVEHSPFPNCFVCGHLRTQGDGLKIHPGAVGKQTVAAPWVPYAELADKNGFVKTEYVWAALDCPGAWAFLDHEKVAVLGRLAVQQKKVIRVEQPHVVMGWVIGQEGRKVWAGTAIYDEQKEICAFAKATWILIKS